MNTRDLEYLVCVADLGHFGKAADACFVSQPALSMQIKKLERYLGVQLLERTNKSVSLTDTGVAIVALARQILQQTEELREAAQAAVDPLGGEIKLGIFPTLGPWLLPYIMSGLSKSLPNLSFYLVEEKTEVLIDQLNNGVLHAAILSLPISEKRLTASYLFEEEFLLAVPHDHPLATHKSVNKEIIDHKKLLLLDDGHCMNSQVVNFCSQTDHSISHAFKATSLEVLRHMVVAGTGMTLMPKLSTKKCSLLSYIPFSTPKPARSVALVYKVSSSKKVLFQEIESQIIKIMRTVL
jgi:LysR family transcriptional regulator, hydrogen peroxide-inducible genes activator